MTDNRSRTWLVNQLPGEDWEIDSITWSISLTTDEEGDILRIAVKDDSETLNTFSVTATSELLRQFRDTAQAGKLAFLREEDTDTVTDRWQRIVNPAAAMEGDPTYWLQRVPKSDDQELGHRAYRWEIQTFTNPAQCTKTPIGEVWGFHLPLFVEIFEEALEEMTG